MQTRILLNSRAIFVTATSLLMTTAKTHPAEKTGSEAVLLQSLESMKN